MGHDRDGLGPRTPSRLDAEAATYPSSVTGSAIPRDVLADESGTLLADDGAAASVRTARLRLLHGGLVEYAAAWEQQRALHAARVAGQSPDTVLLLQHPSVYTAGRRTAWYDRPTDGTPVVEVDRGG